MDEEGSASRGERHGGGKKWAVLSRGSATIGGGMETKEKGEPKLPSLNFNLSDWIKLGAELFLGSAPTDPL